MAARRSFINIITDDLEGAPRLYVELLGFRVVFRSAWFVHLQAPDTPALELGFLRRDHEVVPEAARARPAGGMLTLVVDDVDVVHQRASELGLEILEAPRDLFYGQRRMLLRDPNGLVLDVSSECAPDPAWMARVRQDDDGSYVEV